MKNIMILVLALLIAGTTVNGQEKNLPMTYGREIYEKTISVFYPTTSKMLVSPYDSGRLVIEHPDITIVYLRYFNQAGEEKFDVRMSHDDTITVFSIINNPDSLEDSEITYVLRNFVEVLKKIPYKIKEKQNYHREDSFANSSPVLSSADSKSEKLEKLILSKKGDRKIGEISIPLNSHEKIIVLIEAGYSFDPNPGMSCFYYHDNKKMCNFSLYINKANKQIIYFITNKSPSITYEEMNKILRKWIDTIK